MSIQKIQIQIVIDLVCPYCFLGKRRLDKAIAAFQAKRKYKTPIQFDIQWLPYQLVPSASKISIPKSVYYIKRFGEKRSKQMIAIMIETGKSEGIDFDYSGYIGNTFDAHRLIYYAHQRSKGNEIVEALFHNYFELARDIADNNVLIDIATNIGLDKDEANQFINSSKDAPKVQKLLKANKSQLGIPNFIIQGKYHIAEAADPKVLIEAFEEFVNYNV